MAREFKPDLIFIQIQTEGILTEHTAAELAKISFVINWTGDIRAELPSWFINVGKHIHLTAFSNMLDVNQATSAGVNSDYLQIGIDERRYAIHGIQKSGPAIVAHFNDYGSGFFPLSHYRIDIVNVLQNEFGNNFGVYGNFKNALGDFNANQVEESRNYNRAKIAINCSHFAVERYTSDRLLRIMASGCMALSHYYSGIEHDFEQGRHLDTFWNLPDLVHKCKYYLDNNQERENIAKAGYEHIRNNFTFLHMAQNIVTLYEKHKIMLSQ